MIKTESTEITAQRIIVALLSMIIPLILYHLRFLDDNRLTSWNWVFRRDALPSFMTAIATAVVLAYPLALILDHRAIQTRKEPFLFLFSFCLGSLFWREPEVIVDVARYFSQAKHLATYGVSSFFFDWGNVLFAWTDLPLIPFIHGMGFKLFGESRVVIQTITTLFFSGTVLLTFRIGKTLRDEETGWTAALLLLGFPYLFTQVPLMLVDIPTMFFLTLAIHTFIQAMEKETRLSLGVAALAFVLAFFSKYSTWALLTIHGVIAICYMKNQPARVVKRASLVAIAALVLIGLAVFPKKDVFLDQIDFLIKYQKPGLKRWGESYISTFFFQTHPFIGFGALLSLAAAIRNKDHKYPIIAFLIALLLVILQIKRIRYTLPVFPMFALLGAYGLRDFFSSPLRTYITSCIITSSLAVALTIFLPFLCDMSDSNIKKAATLIDASESEYISVYTAPPPQPAINPIVYIPILDYFTDKTLRYIGGNSPDVDNETIKTSPLRFTWEFKLPDYYNNVKGVDGRYETTVLLTGRDASVPPEDITKQYFQGKQSTDFTRSTGILRNTVFVKVFH